MTSWSHVVWYTARASGYTALALLTLAVALGLLLSLRVGSPRWPRFLTNDLHEHVTLVALWFVGLHGVSVLVDPYMRFGWADVLVPLASPYRPPGMALGILGGYLWLAVWLSAKVRRQIGYTAWRRLHYATYGVYAFALLHTVLVGTDAGSTWAIAVEAGGAVAIGGLTLVRVLQPPARAPAPPALDRST